MNTDWHKKQLVTKMWRFVLKFCISNHEGPPFIIQPVKFPKEFPINRNSFLVVMVFGFDYPERHQSVALHDKGKWPNFQFCQELHQNIIKICEWFWSSATAPLFFFFCFSLCIRNTCLDSLQASSLPLYQYIMHLIENNKSDNDNW